MHAVVFEVDMKQDRASDADAELDGMVAATKEDAGFVSGTWMGDGTRGLAVLVYESEEAAHAACDGASIPPEASVALRAVSFYEVQRQA